MKIQRLLDIKRKIKGLKAFKCRETKEDSLYAYFKALGIEFVGVDDKDNIHSYYVVTDSSIVIPEHMPDWFKELNHNSVMTITGELLDDGEIEDFTYCENFYKYESPEYTEVTL
jgi:DNA-binding LacI/PurR family transcriptional regulator